MSTQGKTPPALRLLAELVVIVVGVLIALWVDNLNTERLERRQEKTYLRGVLEDLRTDSLALAERGETAQRSLFAADRLLMLRRDFESTAPADSLANWLLRAAFVDNFVVQDHTYREILGAGGLSLIRDPTVRRSISSYYRSIESAEFFTDWYKKEEEAYWDLLGRRLDPEDFAVATGAGGETSSLNPTAVVELLRIDNEVANAILMNRHWAQLRLEITERRTMANGDLREALSSHLSNTGAL
jgi:hypothetical protein